MIGRSRHIEEIVKHLFLLILAAFTLIPLVWMVTTSFKPENGVFAGPLFWSDAWNFEGYRQVFSEIPFSQWMMNSALIAILETAGKIAIGILAAYAFAHFRFRGREILFFFVLLTMMMPPQVTMVPIYLIVKELDLLDSFSGVIIPHLASGYAIFLLRQCFLTVPKELGDASVIDGCHAFGTLWHVYLRLSGPVISALAVILFVGVWNDYQWPLLVLTERSLQTLPVAFNQFRQEQSLDYVPTMAVAALSMVPVIILFLAAQKYFIEGFAQSGLKG